MRRNSATSSSTPSGSTTSTARRTTSNTDGVVSCDPGRIGPPATPLAGSSRVDRDRVVGAVGLGEANELLGLGGQPLGRRLRELPERREAQRGELALGVDRPGPGDGAVDE